MTKTWQLDDIRSKYEEALRELSTELQIDDLRCLLLNMMDWTEQSEAEDIYVLLYKTLPMIADELEANGVDMQEFKKKFGTTS